MIWYGFDFGRRGKGKRKDAAEVSLSSLSLSIQGRRPLCLFLSLLLLGILEEGKF